MNRQLFLFVFIVFCTKAPSVIAQNQQPERVYSQRMAAFNRTIIRTLEKVPVSSVTTYYRHGYHYMQTNQLLHLIAAVEINGELKSVKDAANVSVEDFPGGVTAAFTIGNIQIRTDVRPLLVGRESKFWEGAVLYDVSSTPAAKIKVIISQDNNDGTAENLLANKTKDTTGFFRDFYMPARDAAVFKAAEDNLWLGLRTSGYLLKDEERKTSKKTVCLDKGSGQILITYSADKPGASRLAKTDFSISRNAVDEYYSKLLHSSFIETPDTVMNKAFRSAIYNMEYAWLEPMGWLECLHHWFALWHMQAGAAADWLGQGDRNRSSILKHARNLINPDSTYAGAMTGSVAVKPFKAESERGKLVRGSVPQFLPNGVLHYEFGGSNQFWMWQLRHYLQQTGDKKMAKEIIPYVDKIIAQILHEHDKDGNQLLSWGLQIGNQEDFIANPHDGTVPSIEFMNICKTRAELAALTGDAAGAAIWNNKADAVKSKLRRQLWMPDLGRFAFFRDPLGHLRLDGQYQTFLYPVIYDVVDALDQYTGLRHLSDRLTGDDGAVYVSNNFSWHTIGTWGMQKGEAAQPWAAWGLAKAGMNNQAWKPLKAMANWAMDINHRGAWPEVADEPYPAYFTPPASLYIASTIESVFGLKMKATENRMDISPSFPDHWPHARLELPGIKAIYQKEDNHFKYTIRTENGLVKKLSWKLPVGMVITCLVNGKSAPYKLTPGVQGMTLEIDNITAKDAIIDIEISPKVYSVTYPASIAEGDVLKVSCKGIKIEGIEDRMGVLNSVNWHTDSISAVIKTGLLKPYESFGRLGQLNFSRRTFFIRARFTDGQECWLPVDITILPRCEAAFAGEIAPKENGFSVPVKIRNNTTRTINGAAELQLRKISLPFQIHVKSKTEDIFNVNVPASVIDSLSAGQNEFTVTLADNGSVTATLVAKDILKTRKKASFVPINLPAGDMLPDTLWNSLRVVAGYPHIFFTFSNHGWPEPMKEMKDTSITVPELPGVTFTMPGRKFIPVSHKSGKPFYKLQLPKGRYKKIYLLVIPFVDNHDVFSKVGTVSVYANNTIVYNHVLHYPGDVDYWVPNNNPQTFATYRGPRNDRFGLLPLLGSRQGDWNEGKPPLFPQHEYWSSSLPVVNKFSVMNVIELSLPEPGDADYVIFESIGAYPAFGIVAAAAERY